MKKILVILTAVLLVAVPSIFIFRVLHEKASHPSATESLETKSISNLEPKKVYGIVVDSLKVLTGTIQKGDVLGDILSQYGIGAATLDGILKSSVGIFDVRKIKLGNPYSVLFKEDTLKRCQYFVYEINPIDYVVYNFCNPQQVYIGHKPVERDTLSSSGVINGSLYETMMAANASPELAMKLANVYAWTVDFYHVQNGDAFKAIYVENFVEGKSVGIDHVVCAQFNYGGRDIYSFRFKQDSSEDAEYFDADGRSLRKAFLKMPLEYGRMTSGYNLNRYHPILHKVKAHLGTDFAAPAGTPILATGDGTVLEASYTSGNGNYVKIKHNSVYTTQYLHMSGFAKGIKAGAHVTQGQVIGYVGSTGLATGPHVCYRFWKNGEQVDPRKEEIPSGDPVKKENLEKFNLVKDKWMKKLEEIKTVQPV